MLRYLWGVLLNLMHVSIRCLVPNCGRCNLTVLQEPGQEDLAEFLAKNKVCYSAEWKAKALA